MKRIIEVWCLSILSCMSVSCDDMLNPEPENSVTYYNFFKTEQDVSTTVFGIHSLFRAVLYDNYQPFVASGEVADAVNVVDDDLRGLRNLDGSLITPSRPFLSWQGHYNVITQAMTVIENIDRVKLPEDRYNYYLGQALFFKAYMYFQIIQTWGDCPYIDLSYVVKAEERKTWQSVLDTEIKAMERVVVLLEPWKELVDVEGTPVETLQIPGREAAYALLAHMYAFKGTLCDDNDVLQKGIDAATYVIDKGGFSLARDPEEVCEEVMMGHSSESVFEAEIVYSELHALYAQCHMEQLYQGYPIEPYAEIGDIINKSLYIKGTTVQEIYKGGDLRKNSYFYMVDSMINNEKTYGWALMQKRREIIEDRSTTSNPLYWFRNFAGNEVIYRLSEILLLRAEMYAKKGEDGPAKADLKRVRDRAKAPGYTAAEGDLYYVIFKEREKELICERHRRFDITRTGFYKELSEAFARLTPQDVADGALFLPVNESAFFDNSLMRQNRFWVKKW